MLCQGHRPTAVMHTIAEEFGVSERTVTDDLAAVRDQWATEAAEERPRAREEMLALVDAARLEAVKDRKHGDVARLLKLRAEVAGLVGPKSIAVAVSGAGDLSDDEIRQRALALVERARARAAGVVAPPDDG